MLNDIKKEAQVRMGKVLDAFRHELTLLRTGRATTAIVDHLKVNYYGSDMPLNQVATVSILDARSAEKFALLHVKGAKNLSLPDMTEEELAKILPSKATRILGATWLPTSTSSIIRFCAGLAISSVARPAWRIATRASPSPSNAASSGSPSTSR